MLICQSCGMDISDDNHKGTNTDKILSKDYCSFGFANGSFSNNMTLDEQVERAIINEGGEHCSTPFPYWRV